MNLSYRDEVPPVPQKTKPKLITFTPKTWIFIALGVAAILLGVFLLMFSSGNNVTPQMQRLSARLNTTLTISEDATQHIQNADLRKLNSDIRILTTGSIAKLQPVFTSAGAGTIPNDIKAAEADAATTERIERAKTGGDFDGVYKQIIEQKMDTIIALMIEIYDNTNNNDTRTALSESYNDFVVLRDQLRELEL